jgi:hypothetical protein
VKVVASGVESKGYGTYEIACSDQESVPYTHHA